MSDYIAREEHDEFKDGLKAEHARTNARLREVEEVVKEIHTMSTTLIVLCEKMSSVNNSIDALNADVDTLKARDGEMWRKIVAYILTTVAGIIIGYIFKQIGM